MVRRIAKTILTCALGLIGLNTGAGAQTNGSVVGRVIDAQTRAPLTGVAVSVMQLPHRTVSGPDGRFVIGAVPPGEHIVRAELIGYQPLTVDRVLVRAGRAADIRFELVTTAVQLPGVVVQADRARLIEPEISSTHEAIVAREIRELPIDRLSEIIELTLGVSEGHFRGGRVGQEIYVVDGLSLKNQFEASTHGFGLELSPSSLEEVDVITGGFGAAYGAALSGVVSYSTRRGNPERWDKRASFTTDHWAPASLFRGFTGLSLSAGGPVSWLGQGTTLFADLLLQGMHDADSRAAGLTCLTPDLAEPAVSTAINNLRNNANTAHLVCPFTSERFPHQRGDKYIGFLRLDRPVGGLHMTASLLRNRFQRQLYTSEFKYNPDNQLGQRTLGTLATLSGEWLRQRQGSARSVTGRVAVLRLDRFLGALDPASVYDRFEVAGFGPGGFEFLGEDYVRQPIAEQLRAGIAVPGYVQPGGSNGSPFGPAGAGIFFTGGTPTLANWTRSDMVSADVIGAYFSPSGSAYRTGASAKLYRVETYERVFGHLSGSVANYARFYPGTYSVFGEADIVAENGLRLQFGLRGEAFRSGINFRFDRSDFTSPIFETGWQIRVLPRVAAVFPIPGTNNQSAVRLNFSRVAQAPDFQYFLDSTIGDSLRTDLRRQGNPNLSFELGTTYEIGVSHLFNDHFAVAATAFRKNLDELVTGSVRPGDFGTAGVFTTSDFGRVRGIELSARARWPGVSVRGGWAWQKATGLTSGLDNDTAQVEEPGLAEFPLAFDRRHSIDLAVFLGRGGGAEVPWSATLTTAAQSGYPFFNERASSDTPPMSVDGKELDPYLPWTWTTDLRASWDFGSLSVCGLCSWRVFADGRNILNRKNIIGLRRPTGSVSPTLAEVQAVANRPSNVTLPIVRESPLYSALIDLNRDGSITSDEFQTARMAAALDRFDPSLYYGESRQLRIGVEVVF